MGSKRQARASMALAHEGANGVCAVGLAGKVTMRQFDERCLTPVAPLTAEEIREIRKREQVSAPAFAWYLNVGEAVVRKWEEGSKRPSGSALKLLTLVKNKGLIAIVS